MLCLSPALVLAPSGNTFECMVCNVTTLFLGIVFKGKALSLYFLHIRDKANEGQRSEVLLKLCWLVFHWSF